jgi:hypothetical protein
MIKSERTRWAGYVACAAEKIAAYRVVIRNPEAKRPL